jgi:hypothetical protein
MEQSPGNPPCCGVCPEFGQLDGGQVAAHSGMETLRVIVTILGSQAVRLTSARALGSVHVDE